MDDELKNLIESTAAETRRHFDLVAERTRLHVDVVAEKTRRHFDVVAEGLESKMQVIADGVIAAERRIERVEATMSAEFSDVKSMIKFSHHELDRRLRTLEETVSDLQARVERLESATH